MKKHLKFNNKKTNNPIKKCTKDLRRQKVSIWKDAPRHMSWGKCKLKQWNTHLLEWPKSKPLGRPKTNKYVEKLELFIYCCWDTKWVKVKVKVTQLCPTLCDPMDYMVHGILQARILEWVAFPFSRGSSPPRNWTQVFHIAGRFFTSWATRKVYAKWV